jgi:hypothetical protein
MNMRTKTILLQTGREDLRFHIPERSTKKRRQGLVFEPKAKTYRWIAPRSV